MTLQRILKIISSSGLCSRRKAEELMLQKRVTLCEILVDGIPIKTQTNIKVILLNKPIDYITTCDDPYQRPTVFHLLPKEYQNGLHPVGRLDYKSRGALLLTNDGELTFKLTHPRHSHSKTYQVLISGRLHSNKLEEWRS